MTSVRYIHWKHSEAPDGIAKLEKAGFRVVYDELTPEIYPALKANLPDALVINLDRLPSHGREMALYFRSTKKSCQVPIVFVGGKPEKVAIVKEKVPGAVFTAWRGIQSAIDRAICNAPKNPIKPVPSLSGYSGTPLIKKLGIKPDSILAIVNGPPGFEKTLGKLPAGVTVRKSARGKRDTTIWFLRSLKELEDKIDMMSDAVGDIDSLWIAWPKQAAQLKSDVTQTDVRKIGLLSGLVDYKICAIDQTWSGLKFARRKKQ